jgi:hypothetical protein
LSPNFGRGEQSVAWPINPAFSRWSLHFEVIRQLLMIFPVAGCMVYAYRYEQRRHTGAEFHGKGLNMSVLVVFLSMFSGVGYSGLGE